MSVEKDYYKISFKAEDSKKFNRILENLSVKIQNDSSILEYKILEDEDGSSILIPADSESLSFISTMIQEIEEFELVHRANWASINTSSSITKEQAVSSNTNEHATFMTIKQKIEDLMAKSNIAEATSSTDEQIEEEQTSTNENVKVELTKEVETVVGELVKEKSTEKTKMSTNKQVKYNSNRESQEVLIQQNTRNLRQSSKSKLIKEYILRQNAEFSILQISRIFPNVPVVIIKNVVRLSMQRGLIIQIDTDMYKTK